MAIQKITSGIIADGAIVATDIADGIVTNAKLAGSITGDKIGVGQITANLFAAGAVSTTSISNGNSNVTIASANSNVSIFTAGTERVRFNSSGNVGIGTTSPNFQVSFGANIGKTLAVFENAGTSVYGIGMGGAGTGGDPYRTKLFSNGTENASITDAGVFSFNSGYGSVATAYGCRAWVNFNGTGTPAIRKSGNVSSVSDEGTGDYYVSFTASIVDNEYCVVASVTRSYTSASNNALATTGDLETGRFAIQTSYGDNGTNVDFEGVQAIIVR